MLNAIRVGNFKAFGDSQRIPLRPLTLIYGANSSGKSSLIHSLIFARHAQETGELDVHRTSIGGESVDLGGFRQYIHRRDVSRRMEWSAELNTASFTGRLAELLAPVKRIAASLTIGIPMDDQGRLRPGALPEIHAYELIGDDKSLVGMSRRRDGNLHLDRLDQEHSVFRKVLRAIVETSTTTESLLPSDYEGLDEVISEVVPEIVGSMGKFLPEGLAKTEVFAPGTQPSLFPVSRGRRKEDLAAAVRFFMPRTLDELIRGVGRAVGEELTRLQYLGPLRSYPPRHLAFSQHHDPNWYAGGGYAWDVVRRDARVREQVNTWLGAPERLQTQYELIIRELVGIDDLETPVLDGLERLGDDGLVIEPDYDDEPFPEGAYPRIKDVEKEVKQMVETIRDADIEKLNELIMIDRTFNTIVSHRDVGVGVSQVLPVLVGAYAYQNQMIAIEQPEIHLHPALQADLGDVFIHSALGEQQNTFIIETHSEHLILRILRRIRETTEGELSPGKIPVKPEHIQVIYAQPTSKGTVLHNIGISEDGEFLEKWPDGFFPERAKELF